jgi:hypothetical protein
MYVWGVTFWLLGDLFIDLREWHEWVVWVVPELTHALETIHRVPELLHRGKVEEREVR